jgi:hypothetical protein
VDSPPDDDELAVVETDSGSGGATAGGGGLAGAATPMIVACIGRFGREALVSVCCALSTGTTLATGASSVGRFTVGTASGVIERANGRCEEAGIPAVALVVTGAS